MKKVLLALSLVFLSIGFIQARSEGGRFEIWRSTENEGPIDHVPVATGSIYVARIVVTSGTTGSIFQLYNSSSTDPGVDRSTSAEYSAATAIVYPFNRVYERGLAWTIDGGATIEIHWDWINNAPAGQENRGR